MEEKVIGKKCGMAVLLAVIALYALAVFGIIYGGNVADAGGSPVVAIVSAIWLGIGWLPLLGLKVLRPQEALVLTLFGKYAGTLKGDGFYFVNPFCTAINPAAKTKLSQSSDVDSGKDSAIHLTASNAQNAATADKRISLKIMTLNNARQKINDRLGTPVEIGIAVMWRVRDTAKAVFEVDNYKEYLSLQCDSALRNIVRIYPYDTAPDIDTTGDGMADEGSLRGSSEVVAARIRDEIQERVSTAGLEIIEARWLFDMPPEKIDVLIHPQSIVHSMIEFADGGVLAQLGVPDMRLPILYAMAFPDRLETGAKPLDLAQIGSLTFEAPDRAKFPGMFLAYDALRAGGAACAMLNAANEVAVGAFLSGRIPFGRIWQLNRDTLEAAGDQPADSVEAVFVADALARRVAEGILTRTGA